MLWEYDMEHFDYEQSAAVVIERVIERGTMEEWREIIKYYGREKVLEVARDSRQLDQKHKKFTKIYVYSEYNAI
ncbi:MAG: hypothetical protein IPJ74_20435 [Saprospiraceae bacterium]|nr:hypothetical protein [Saprospiraceae bacterium]